MRILRGCVAMLVCFEVVYFLLELETTPTLSEQLVALHALAVMATATVLALTALKWFQRNWRPTVLAALIVLFALTLWMSLLTEHTGPLLIMVALGVIGAAAIIPWDTQWQAVLTTTAIAVMIVRTLELPSSKLNLIYEWFAVLTAAALGHLIVLIWNRYRHELALRLERLRESQAILRTIFEAAPDAIAITRMSDGALLEVNREFLKTGYKPQEVLVLTGDRGRWTDQQRLRQMMRQLRTYGSVRDFETELRNKDGGLVQSLISATLVEIKGEECVVSMARDIGDLKRAQHELISAREKLWNENCELEDSQRQLRTSEDKLRKVLEASSDAITINRLSDGKYIDFNQAFSEATGFSRDDAIGHSSGEIGLWAEREQLKRFLRRLNTDGNVSNFACDFRAKDGRMVEHLLSASIIELDGEPCVVSVSRNVSDLRHKERELRAARDSLFSQVRALRESQEKLWTEVAERQLAQRRAEESESTLRRIFETSLDIITISRLRDGLFIAVNDEFVRATGYSRADALVSTSKGIKLFKDRERVRRLVEELSTDGFVRNLELEVRTKSGKLIPQLFSATVVDVLGEPCVISFLRNISALKQTERDLIAAQQALSAQVEALSLSQQRLQAEIAERESTGRRLAASEAKLRKIFETSVDAITITRFPSRELIDCNPEFLRISGLDRAEAMTLDVDQTGIWCDRKVYREFLRQIEETGFVRSMEADLRRRDGEIFPYLVSATLTQIDGHPCIVTLARDISSIKHTERELLAAREELSAQVRALNESQDRLRAEIAERELAQHRLQENEHTLRKIFETSLDAIVVNRWPDMIFVDLNERFTQLFGVAKERALSTPPGTFRVWARPDQYRRFTSDMAVHGFIQDMEADFILTNGTVAPFLISSVMVELRGQPCVVSMVRDISHLKHAERELIAAREAALAASEAKSEFLSSMSHEIRTPMNAILGMTDLLWETPLSDEQHRYLDTMRSNGDALLNLINGILDLAKVESGRLSLERADFDITELTESVVETLSIRAHEKRLELISHILPGVPGALIGDPLRLRQILVNLLGNAIKFTERGEVTLTVEKVAPPQVNEFLSVPLGTDADGGRLSRDPAPATRQLVRFTVKDTGIGIPSDKIEAIFSSFTQADSTTTRRYGGSGLGLTIVKRLVELMDGEIQVESKVGCGSVFSFTVPLEVQPSAALASSALSDERPLAGLRVILAHDAPSIGAILTEQLRFGGAEVTQVATGAEAFKEAGQAGSAGEPYDAIVVDYNRMAAADGTNAARRLLDERDPATGGETIVVTLTAEDLKSRTGPPCQNGATKSPRYRYVIKPVRCAELWKAVLCARHDADADAAFDNKHANGATAHPTTASVAAAPEASASDSPPIVSRPLRVLLAEDSPDNQLLIQAYLKNTPYTLDVAQDGEAAVRKFVGGRYDVILMDVQMPVMDGYSAVAAIRGYEDRSGLPRTPIIALTASAHDEAARRSLQMGCDLHVSKPVKKATVLTAIRDAVESVNRGALQAAGANGAARLSDWQSGDPIVVEIDEDLSDLIPGFLARKRRDAGTIVSAADDRESEPIIRLGHKIKGEGGSYGLHKISDIGRDLEQAGRRADFGAARSLAHDLTDFLDRLHIEYRQGQE